MKRLLPIIIITFTIFCIGHSAQADTDWSLTTVGDIMLDRALVVSDE